MTLAIFGATGTVGSELLSQALAAGHEVRALVRDPRKIGAAHPRLAVVQGDVRDRADVNTAIKGCDAALSALGASGKDDPDTRRVGTANIVSAMRDSGIDRLVVMGGFHVSLAGEEHSIGQRLAGPLIRLGRIAVSDTTALGDVVTTSGLDWTFVRSTRVVPGGPTDDVRVDGAHLGPWSKITRGDIAQFMLRSVDERTYVRQAPMVSS